MATCGIADMWARDSSAGLYVLSKSVNDRDSDKPSDCPQCAALEGHSKKDTFSAEKLEQLRWLAKSPAAHVSPEHDCLMFNALLEQYAMIDANAALNIYMDYLRNGGDSLVSGLPSKEVLVRRFETVAKAIRKRNEGKALHDRVAGFNPYVVFWSPAFS